MTIEQQLQSRLAQLEAQLAAKEQLLKETAQEVARLRFINGNLMRQIYGSRSEKARPAANPEQFELPGFLDEAGAPEPEPCREAKPSGKDRQRRQRKDYGQRPMDQSLPELPTIEVEDPSLGQLRCPVTGRIMTAIDTETIEFVVHVPGYLARQKARRRIFPSPTGTGTIGSPWPATILPRSRVHVSVIAHVADAHFLQHQPLARIESTFERMGAHLPRSNMVNHLDRLDELLEPFNALMLKRILDSGYVHLDATPVPLLDRTRPGAAREATFWGLRNRDGDVAFLFRLSKSPDEIREVFAGYGGILQHDGAPKLDALGDPGRVRHLGCWAHLRRYFEKAQKAGFREADRWMQAFSRIFHLESLCTRYRITDAGRQALRERNSMPLWREMLDAADKALATAPKLGLGEAWNYLRNHKAELEACLATPGSSLDNNPIERSIRPLKVGAKNWLFIGHPSAGDRKANLFGLLENCRHHGINASAYLGWLITRMVEGVKCADLPGLLPAAWKAANP